MWDFEKPAYTTWVCLVESAVLHQVTLMASRRNFLRELSEDALSSVIDIALQNLNLESSAKVVNGNVDIVIEHGNYKWLGEAKIATDVAKIFHGYEQLTSRYATGMPEQTAGGMILYCLHDKANVIMAGWRAALTAEIPESNVQAGPVSLSFRSSDVCSATGDPLEIIHLAVPLHHDPQEDSRKLSKISIQAARAARKEERAQDQA